MTFARDADALGIDGLTLKRPGVGPIKIDLGPIKILPDGPERSGTMTAATLAIDLTARVVIVRGTYMSVNSWFSADKTTNVFVF